MRKMTSTFSKVDANGERGSRAVLAAWERSWYAPQSLLRQWVLTARYSLMRRAVMSLGCPRLVVRWMATIAILLPSAGFAENWPGFRGPTGQGISQEKNLPLTWSLRENLAWRTDLPGIGWSSPIVWGDRVFVTTATPDGTACRMLCLDVADGNVVWEKELFRQTANRKLAENSHATPTPVTDGELVYAAFNGGRIVAVDFNGNVAWNWRDNEFVSKHGLAVSPILYRDQLIMPFDGNGPEDVNNIGYRTAWDGAFIAALDKRTWQERWRSKRDLSRQAHVTPMVIEVNGKPQLISGAGDVVQGFDPDSGERLWTVRSLGEGVVPSIVCAPGLVFVQGVSRHIRWADLHPLREFVVLCGVAGT